MGGLPLLLGGHLGDLGVADPQLGFAQALRHHALQGDAFRREVVHAALRPVLAQGQVIGVRTTGVGVRAQLDDDGRVVHHGLVERLQGVLAVLGERELVELVLHLGQFDDDLLRCGLQEVLLHEGGALVQTDRRHLVLGHQVAILGHQDAVGGVLTDVPGIPVLLQVESPVVVREHVHVGTVRTHHVDVHPGNGLLRHLVVDRSLIGELQVGHEEAPDVVLPLPTRTIARQEASVLLAIEDDPEVVHGTVHGGLHVLHTGPLPLSGGIRLEDVHASHARMAVRCEVETAVMSDEREHLILRRIDLVAQVHGFAQGHPLLVQLDHPKVLAASCTGTLHVAGEHQVVIVRTHRRMPHGDHARIAFGLVRFQGQHDRFRVVGAHLFGHPDVTAMHLLLGHRAAREVHDPALAVEDGGALVAFGVHTGRQLHGLAPFPQAVPAAGKEIAEALAEDLVGIGARGA